MKSLIIGYGEVGKALYKLLNEYYEVEIQEKGKKSEAKKFEIIHIAFPYSDNFEKEVLRYQQTYKPKYTVIHSTVKVGTSRKLNAFHSPIRGKHPFLFKSLLTFEKMLGGKNSEEVADYFRYAGIKIRICQKQETTELAKILDTTYYGLCIEFAKETERICKEHEVPFSEVYTLSNKEYNEGYEKMGNPEFM